MDRGAAEEVPVYENNQNTDGRNGQTDQVSPRRAVKSLQNASEQSGVAATELYDFVADSAAFSSASEAANKDGHEDVAYRDGLPAQRVAENRAVLLDAAELLGKKYGTAELDRLVAQYCDAYYGIYGVIDASMSEDEATDIYMKYLEEICADAYAQIRRGGINIAKAEAAMETYRTDTQKQTAAATERTNGPNEDGTRYSIGKTTGNKPFVEVEQDILAGVPEADWAKTVKENLKQKFPSGITVGNNEIHIDKQSRREMTFSRYMQRLYNTDPQLRVDKLRATNNADEILQATTDWVNEGLNHPRKDNIRDFARGEVLLRVGGNDYTADVVVGTRENGSMLMYDILNLQPTSFTEKETDAAITVNPSPGVGRNTASISVESVAQNAPSVKQKYSFGGEKARSANIEALREAQEMQARGVDMESIRKATGWHEGMDGKWRFEIDDSEAEYRKHGDARLLQEEGYRRLVELTDKWAASYEKGGAAFTEAEENEMVALQEEYSDRVWEEKYELQDFLKHDKLYEAYPMLRHATLKFQKLDDGTNGYYSARDNTIALSTDLIGKPEETLLHEIQHAIQNYEGFSGGTSPEYWARKDYENGTSISERLQKRYDDLLNGLSKEEQNRYIRYMELERELDRLFLPETDSEDGRKYAKLEAEQDALYEELWPNEWFRKLLDLGRRIGSPSEAYYQMYRNSAGEIEARDSENRRALTAEQRREKAPDYGSADTVFADGGESYSIVNTRDMPWEEQVQGYFRNDGTIKSSDSLYLGKSSVDGVDNAPMFIPTSVITKAIRSPKGSRSAHALSRKNILSLQEDIKNAPVVIDNPARNSIIYVTEMRDPARNYIVATLDKNNDLYGENAHRVTSIHGRENIAAMLEKLGDDATVFVRNENKLNQMLPGNQILKSLALRAKVELDDTSVAQSESSVKQKYSMEDDTRELDAGYRRAVEKDAAENEPRGRDEGLLPEKKRGGTDYAELATEEIERRANRLLQQGYINSEISTHAPV